MPERSEGGAFGTFRNAVPAFAVRNVPFRRSAAVKVFTPAIVLMVVDAAQKTVVFEVGVCALSRGAGCELGE